MKANRAICHSKQILHNSENEEAGKKSRNLRMSTSRISSEASVLLLIAILPTRCTMRFAQCINLGSGHKI